MRSKSQSGFTLIELLVVITIIAVLAGAVSIVASPGGPKKTLETEARRLAAVISMAADEAIFSGQELGLMIYRDGYQFFTWQEPESIDNPVGTITEDSSDGGGAANTGANLQEGESESVGEWMIHEDRVFRSQQLPHPVMTYLEIEGEEQELDEYADRYQAAEGDAEGNESAVGSGGIGESEEEGVQPTILILSSGEVTPFKVDLFLDSREINLEDEPVYTIESDLLGNVTLKRPGDEDNE